jgi:uncharacterized coiled-coil protein SlyX
MEEYREPGKTHDSGQSNRRPGTEWLIVGIVVLVIIGAFAIAYGFRQQNLVGHLNSHQADLNSQISQMQDQISSLTSRLNQAPPAQPAAAPAPATSQQPTDAALAARRRAAAQNKKLKQMEAQLTDQQKQLKDTQDALDQTRSDFSNSLNSTRDELNGSIAHTHEELVALEQRGERNYFEFDLTRSKNFQHAGPIQVSLRKSDPKHRTFDLAMLVDDNVLNKRKVDLFEPIWISGSDTQPLQIVVNNISKDHVHGYVSAAKYPQPRVVATSASGSAGVQDLTTASPISQASPQTNPSSNPQ